MSEPTPTPDRPSLIVPPELQAIRVGAGTWCKYLRLLVGGEAKSGKSHLLADFPKPIIAGSAGDEQGIAEYLDPTQGDECFDITTPVQLEKFIMFAAKYSGNHFHSVVIDPITALWTDYMDWWGEKKGGQILGPDWKEVKGPWKIFMRTGKRLKAHFGMSAWQSNVVYEQLLDSSVPAGVEQKAKLNIRQAEVFKTEKNIPYHVDMILQTRTVLDQRDRPTPIHEVIFRGGRRPRTIDPAALYTGKTWKFDERKPVSTWDTIIAPYLAKWQDATAGAVEYVGMDERAAVEEDSEELQVTNDYLAGNMIRLIAGHMDGKTYKEAIWKKEVFPYIDKLPPALKQSVIGVHEEAKKRLGLA